MTRPGPVDTMGVPIAVGDRVRVTAWGSPVRLADTGRCATVTGFTPAGNVKLREDATITALDPIARGRAVPPRMIAVARRDGTPGHEGNAR